MKKLLIFALAAFAFVACKKDDEGSSQFSITVDGGTADTNKADEGATITVTADDPEEGMEFKNWTSNPAVEFDNANAEETTFTMPAANVKVTAVFGIESLDVTVNGGTADPAIGVEPGTVVMLTPDPDPGYEFMNWTSEQIPASGFIFNANGLYSFIMPEEDVTINAVVNAIPYSITVVGGTADKRTAIVGDVITLSSDLYSPMPADWDSEEVDEFTFDRETETFTFIMPPTNVTVTADFNIGTSPYILFLNENGALDLGRWEAGANRDNVLFVKFGSIIAVKNQNYDPETSLLFNPTNYTSTDLNSIKMIDCWGSGFNGVNDDPAGLAYNYVSTSEYHKDSNLTRGRGDICKLVGLTSARAKQLLSENNLDMYDSGFRLPTDEENRNSGYVIKEIAPATEEEPAHRALWINEDSDTLLPGCGQLVGAGEGSIGLFDPVQGRNVPWYWSSTPGDAINTGKCMSGSVSENSVAYPSWITHNALSIRCVLNVE